MRIALLSLAFILRLTGLAQTTGNITGVQTSCATSGEGRAGNFIISYTIGEMTLVESWQQNGLLITQGIYQPGNRGVAASANSCFTMAEVNVFPNPNPGNFSLQLSLLKQGAIQVSLMDAAGKQCMTEQFNYTGFMIRTFSIHHLAAGAYLLQVAFAENNQASSKKCVYTIVKTN